MIKIKSTQLKTYVVVLNGLPLFLIHREGVWTINHKCFCLRKRFQAFDQSFLLVIIVKEDVCEYTSNCVLLAHICPFFCVSDGLLFVEKRKNRKLYFSPKHSYNYISACQIWNKVLIQLPIYSVKMKDSIVT